MANFKSFDDLHDFTRKITEDDWNNDQHIVFKLKQSMKNVDLATTLKIGHAQPGENHTVKLEQKNKGTSGDFGGMKLEVKATNDGKVKFSNELTGLFKDIEGMEDSAVTNDGVVSSAGGMKMDLGFKHSGKDHKFHLRGLIQKDPVFETQTVWRPCKSFVIAEKSTVPSSLTGIQSEIRTVTNFNNCGLQHGGWMKATSDGGMKVKDVTMGGSCVQTQGNNTVAGLIDFNYSTMAVKTQIALQNKQEDHTWRLMAHSSGMTRALLQWQLHKCCKATVNTSVDLGELPSGKMAPLPWGFAFEVKY